MAEYDILACHRLSGIRGVSTRYRTPGSARGTSTGRNNCGVSGPLYVQQKNQMIIAFEVHAKGLIHKNDELAEVKVLPEGELKAYDFSPLYITEQIIHEWAPAEYAVHP